MNREDLLAIWKENDVAIECRYAPQLAVTEAHYNAACRFFDSVPEALRERMEAGNDPDGDISFDWYFGRGRCLALSVSISGKLPYAWLNGDDSGKGVAENNGQFQEDFVRILETLNLQSA